MDGWIDELVIQATHWWIHKWASVTRQALLNPDLDIKKLDINDTEDYEDLENKKENNDEEVDNKDSSDQKKETKLDENQEMAIDTNVTDIDNAANEVFQMWLTS